MIQSKLPRACGVGSGGCAVTNIRNYLATLCHSCVKIEPSSQPVEKLWVAAGARKTSPPKIYPNFTYIRTY